LRTSLDDSSGAIAAHAQSGGGTAVTTVKNKKRDVLNGLLPKLAHYVQANLNDDVQVLNSGFQAKTNAVRSQPDPVGQSEDRQCRQRPHQGTGGEGQEGSVKSYELQAAAMGANNTVGSFQPAG